MFNPETKLSKHFKLKELEKSHTAQRNGIDNRVKDKIILDNLVALCENVLEPIRTNFNIPFSPNSGYRSLELNRLLGSKDTSQHVKGEAVDIEIPSISNRDLAEWIKRNCDFDNIILEYHNEDDPQSGWVHVSYTKSTVRRKQTLIYNGKEYKHF